MIGEESQNHALAVGQAERDEMKTPEDVAVMLRLHQLGWGKKRIARELGISKTTVKRYVDHGGYQAYRQPERRKTLDGKEEWLRKAFLQHRGNAEVVRQELVKIHGVEVSLRTVERAVEPYRKELDAAAKATVRFETAPGKQMQIDFGTTRAEVGGEVMRIHLFVATLGYSRRIYTMPFRHERQICWLTGMDSAFRHFDGIPDEVLMDNAKALVKHHNVETREVVFNERMASFASYWGFKTKACAPYRARTKGKDERNVSYVKRNGIAGRIFESWEALENHLHNWCLEIADQRIHGTTGKKPKELFAEEAAALNPLNGKPPFMQSRDYKRKVHNDAHVEFQTNHYSVPWRYVGSDVSVAVRQGDVCIYQGNREISRHRRCESRGARITLAEHLEGIVGSVRPENRERTPPPIIKAGELQRDLSEYEAVCGG